jgi:hypothetical protein
MIDSRSDERSRWVREQIRWGSIYPRDPLRHPPLVGNCNWGVQGSTFTLFSTIPVNHKSSDHFQEPKSLYPVLIRRRLLICSGGPHLMQEPPPLFGGACGSRRRRLEGNGSAGGRGMRTRVRSARAHMPLAPTQGGKGLPSGRHWALEKC